MKKIVWLCNVPTPKASEAFGWSAFSVGGWMFWLSQQFEKMDDYQLHLIFISNDTKDVAVKEYDGIYYYAIPNFTLDSCNYSETVEGIFMDLLSNIQPDVIHIWGTEYTHTLAMINASSKGNMLEKCVISIQGLVSVYAKYYFGNLDSKEKRIISLKDIVKFSTLSMGKKKYEKKGIFEQEALKKVKNVIGRTDWDKALTKQFNPEVNYYFNNEVLRSSFYQKEWTYENCKKHTIFISQAHSPIKGLDVLLKALPEVLKYFPDTKVFVAGHKTKSKIKQTSYDRILSKLIKKNKLEHAVEFLGMRNEEEMLNEFLKANIFVSPSAIENSSNSIGEAMLLGTPVISSYVGGIGNLLEHNKEGYLYQSDADYMLAYYIIDLFQNVEKAKQFSKNARAHALKTHDKDKNLSDLLKIYDNIMKTSNME